MATGIAINKNVAKAISGLFALTKDSDCDVIFCLGTAEAPAADTFTVGEEEPASKRQRIEAAPSEGGTPATAAMGSDATQLGDPLPAHQLILRYASERFAAQLDRWVGERLPVSSSLEDSRLTPEQFGRQQPTPPPRRPQLPIVLGSEAEVPAARAAIAFAYSGQVQADSMREILELRRQAAYLGIDDCPTECDNVLKAKLSPVPEGTSQDAGALALEFYACADLFPDGVDDPSFASVLAVGKVAIVRHFGDALATLQRPSLRQQLVALPAAALEALLESDDFGTDTESSVLLLLATWMKENYGKTDEATRKRLCRLVRLVQLGRPYLSFILPALALDFETKPQQQAAWYPIGGMEAAFISHYASASAVKRKRIEEECGDAYDMKSAVYCTKPRRQCVPRGGISVEWHLSRHVLEQGLAALEPGKPFSAEGTFEGDLVAVSDGFEWTPSLLQRHGEASAGIFLRMDLPEAFRVHGSRLDTSSKPSIVATASVSVALHRWRNGQRVDPVTRSFAGEGLADGRSRGWFNLVTLQQQPVAGGAAAGGGVSPLAAWAEYLHDGKVSGSLIIPQPKHVA